MVALALRVQMNLRIGLYWSRGIQSAITFFATCISTSNLRDLIVVVFEGEKLWHVISGYFIFTNASDGVLMHH